MLRILRSLLAVAAGFALLAVFSLEMGAILRVAFPPQVYAGGGPDNPAILTANLCDTIFFAVLGCYMTARIAARHPVRHALVLGALWLLLTLLMTTPFWRDTPAWYHFGILAVILPAAWLGGTLRQREISPA